MNVALKIEMRGVKEFCRRWKVRELAVFGSALGLDFAPHSDVDFLIAFDSEARWDLADMVAMRDELEALVGRPVDVVEKNAIRNPYRRREILSHHEVLYAA